MELVFLLCKLFLERKMLVDARLFTQLARDGDSVGIKIEDLVPQTGCDWEEPINSLVGKCSYSSLWGCFLLCSTLEQKEMRIRYSDLCWSLSNPTAEVASYEYCLYL